MAAEVRHGSDRTLKIALYQWAPLDKARFEGGGVSIYVRNLSQALAEHGHEVHILCSGYDYNVVRKDAYLRRTQRDERGITYWSVVNSRVIAPSFMMFSAVHQTVYEADTRAIVREFLQHHKPFDVFHIQNVEGIPFDVFSLRGELPQTRFILSAHNYGIVCQQANLWKRDRVHCADWRDGRDCASCDLFDFDRSYVAAQRMFERSFKPHLPTKLQTPAFWFLRRLQKVFGWDHKFGFTVEYRMLAKVEERWKQGPADIYFQRRKLAVDLVNTWCDSVICVSEAVKRNLAERGLNGKLLEVRYIGTQHANSRIRAKPASRDSSTPLNLAFLGYTRPDKGFDFLVAALGKMPDHLKGRFSLTFAGQISNPALVHKLRSFRGNLLQDVTIIEGYDQNELRQLLTNIDVGLVLPLWEDALPQVAIEFICAGVPIFVSDRGGQKELAGAPEFVFEAGSITDFWRRLTAIADDSSLLDKFWQIPRSVLTMTDHVAELMKIYERSEEQLSR